MFTLVYDFKCDIDRQWFQLDSLQNLKGSIEILNFWRCATSELLSMQISSRLTMRKSKT